MLRNKVFTALQKTYDDSYLSCSTAVYYESQVGYYNLSIDVTVAMVGWDSVLTD